MACVSSARSNAGAPVGWCVHRVTSSLCCRLGACAGWLPRRAMPLDSCNISLSCSFDPSRTSRICSLAPLPHAEPCLTLTRKPTTTFLHAHSSKQGRKCCTPPSGGASALLKVCCITTAGTAICHTFIISLEKNHVCACLSHLHLASAKL